MDALAKLHLTVSKAYQVCRHAIGTSYHLNVCVRVCACVRALLVCKVWALDQRYCSYTHVCDCMLYGDRGEVA